MHYLKPVETFELSPLKVYVREYIHTIKLFHIHMTAVVQELFFRRGSEKTKVEDYVDLIEAGWKVSW